jgi:hypothetical protein
MPTVTLENTMLGQSVAANGTLTAVRFTKRQSGYRGYFRLIDRPPDPSLSYGSGEIINVEPSTCGLSPVASGFGTNSLLANGRVTFSNLVLDACPPGSKWEIDIS